MFLSKIEHEAFMRGKAAGLIPEETAVPNNETEIDHLIFNIGFLHCRKFAYRDLSSRLKIMTVSTFTKEHLEYIIHNLPGIKPDEVFHVTDFQQEEYPNVLEGLYHYFAFGREIISEDDLAGRLAVDGKIFSKEQMLKGFAYQYQTVISSDAATDRQKLQIMKIIQAKQIPEISQREWDNLTFAEAEKIIAGAARNQELPIPVALALKTIQRLTEKERSLLAKIIMKQNPATRAA